MKRTQLSNLAKLALFSAGIAATGCTNQLKESFRLAQAEQAFDANIQINTKIDLLWVVDNSSSMGTAQTKLRQGFAGFANKYLQPTWDIRIAVISTDTFMANSAFNGWRNSTFANTSGWQSPYLASRSVAFNDPTLVDGTGRFVRNTKNGDLVPAWGPNFAKLLSGMHDGPIAGLCFEGMGYFLNGESKCNIRDNAGNTGVSHCLNPTGAETAVTQCLNTTQNNTVRSGKGIISTMPGSPLTGAALTAWKQQLIDDFMVNATTGANGLGSERGLGSVLQLIADNEAVGSGTSFFREGSTRGIIFVSDEDDQTLAIPSPLPGGFGPYTSYQCDQAGLVALNGAGITASYCCTGGGCQFGAEGTTCASKTIDGHTYTPSICPNPAKLMPVSSVKSQLDSFFLNLDGVAATSANYFVTTITPLTGASIITMQNARDVDDSNAGAYRTVGINRGDRYIELGSLVGNGSMALDIAANDYSALLDSIGTAIIQQKSTFTLTRAPTNQEEMIVKVVHADGSVTFVAGTQYSISGKSIIITDLNLVLSFVASDRMVINYQPKTLF